MAILSVDPVRRCQYQLAVFPDVSDLTQVSETYEKITLSFENQNREFYSIKQQTYEGSGDWRTIAKFIAVVVISILFVLIPLLFKPIRERLGQGCHETWINHLIWEVEEIEDLIKGQEAIEKGLGSLDLDEIDQLAAFCKIYPDYIDKLINDPTTEEKQEKWNDDCGLFLKKLIHKYDEEESFSRNWQHCGDVIREILGESSVRNNLQVMGILVGSFGIPAVIAISYPLASQAEIVEQVGSRLIEFYSQYPEQPIPLENAIDTATRILETKIPVRSATNVSQKVVR